MPAESQITITIICPNLRCRSVLQVSEQVRGQKVRCGRCGKNFIVPASSAARTPAEVRGKTDGEKHKS